MRRSELFFARAAHAKVLWMCVPGIFLLFSLHLTLGAGIAQWRGVPIIVLAVRGSFTFDFVADELRDNGVSVGNSVSFSGGFCYFSPDQPLQERTHWTESTYSGRSHIIA